MLALVFQLSFQSHPFQDQIGWTPVCKYALQDQHSHESHERKPDGEVNPIGNGCEDKDQHAPEQVSAVF